MGIESRIDTPLAAAVRKVGSQSATARLIGKSQTSIYEALRDEKPVWPEAVLTLEAETGLSRHYLRADIYPREDVAPAANRAPDQADAA